MRKFEVLTRSQLKQILGGDGGSGTCGSPWWLCCTTPNGNENWCRSSIAVMLLQNVRLFILDMVALYMEIGRQILMYNDQNRDDHSIIPFLHDL